MRFLCVVILFVFVVKIDGYNVWLKELTSENGLQLGYGVALKVNESKKQKNLPITERLSLDLNFGDVAGVTLGNPKSEGVELDFYINKDKNSESGGRSKKGRGGKHMMKMMIGYKAALMASVMFAILKVLSMKAILLAKAALIISLFVLLLKLTQKRPPEIIEVEQHGYSSPNPYYGGSSHHIGYQPQEYGGAYYSYQGYGRDAQASNIYNDIVYAPSAMEAETNGVYSAIMPNGSVVQAITARNAQEVEKKKDKLYYRKHKVYNNNKAK